MEEYKKYFSFNGVATRSEYWAVTFISLAACFFTVLLADGITEVAGGIGIIFYLLAAVVAIGALITLTATTARRCRDAGINPWFTGLIFVPYVAFIADIVIGVIPTSTESKTE